MLNSKRKAKTAELQVLQSNKGELDSTLELHLDGRTLRNAFETMAKSAEKLGGMEVVVEGLSGKSLLFQRTFVDCAETLSETEFLDACAFMPTVRRRVNTALAKRDFDFLKSALQNLLNDVTIANVDDRMSEFTELFPADKKYRWTRDFAAEILHYRDPETFPLMTRWIWDFGSYSGVLREIWFSELASNRIKAPDGVRTHLELRHELQGFLQDAGVFANLPLMIDVLCAWVYSQYIGSQGGSFLKTDFSHSADPFGYTLRMLGLDAALSPDGKTQLLLPSGKRYSLSSTIDVVAH